MAEYIETGHWEKAQQYIAGVLSGQIPACKYVKEACQRQLNDLARTDWEYEFDVRLAEDKCFYAELLPHIEGPKAGKLIVLEHWQCFILCVVFGWVNRVTRKRRFRRAYTEVPKGNGKSALSSTLVDGMVMADGEGAPQVYCAAPTRDQAKTVFGIAQKMLRRSPRLLEKFGASVNAHDITCRDGFARTFSSDADTVEGANPHFVVVDELHVHPNRQLWDNLESAMGKRDQDLLWAITTAGSDRSGICYEVRSYIVDILAGKKHDETWFGIIYTIDKGDDWAKPESLIKANPNWGISFDPNDRLQKLTKAMQLASAQPSFKTKHLNVWVNTAHSWMDMRKWDACGDPELTEAQFAGCDGILGMDLASRKDLASIDKLFWKDIDGVRHYYVFTKNWVPQAAVEAAENSQYAGWATEERLIAVDGEVNDYRLFTAHLKEACTDHNILEIAHDPYLSDMVIGDMVESGVPATMVKVTQNVENFSPALKELEALVMAGRLHHDGDPVLAWAVSNVEVKPDFKDNIYPRKAKGQDKNKIDPVVALLMALKRAMAQVPPEKCEIIGWI